MTTSFNSGIPLDGDRTAVEPGLLDVITFSELVAGFTDLRG